MYLARLRTKESIRYVIRHSYFDQGNFKHRDLFDLGADPTRYIRYPGGNSYYFDPLVEEAIFDKGVDLSPDDLDRIFFNFLQPEIQRVVIGFDRGFKNSQVPSLPIGHSSHFQVHLFDKRRYHYLRFGHSSQRYIQKVPEKHFKFLHNRSRDELEHYFESEEHQLSFRDIGPYMATVFQLSAFRPQPDGGSPLLPQLDRYFLDQLCRLDEDEKFRAGTAPASGLYPHLIRYALFWFDHAPAASETEWQYIQDFINRHRAYRPPVKTMKQIKEAETLFGYDWKELKRMDGPSLTRIFRRLALKHHPDQGGDAETFHRLTHYYQLLMQKKPKGS